MPTMCSDPWDQALKEDLAVAKVEIERLREWLEIISRGEHVHPDGAPETRPGDFHPGPCVMGCPVWAAKRALEGE